MSSRNRNLILAASAALALPAVLLAPDAWTQAADRMAVVREQIQRAVADPFKGITTNGSVEPGLFAIESTGVSTDPVRAAADAFLAALTQSQRVRTRFSVDDIHTLVRTPNGNDYGKDLLRQRYARHKH